MSETNLTPIWPLLAAALAFLIPLAVALVASAGLPESEARQTALTPLAAFALAVIGYVLVGFGLHYGGAGLVVDHPDLAGLVWEWSPISADWGADWGMAGWAGFGMSVQNSLTYLLLISTLPWATTAALLPMLALRGRAPALVTALFGLLAAMIGYPLIGNWVQGGGWLARLGFNIGAGHGYVDFGGASLFLMAGGVALAGILVFLERLPKPDRPAELPPVHLPLLAVVGAGLLLVGSTGWLLAWPLTDWEHLSAVRVVANALLAAAGGAALPLFYTWFVAAGADALQGARGAAAGWVAGLAAAPFLSPSAALLVGAVAGLLMLLAGWLIDHRLRLQDRGGVLATFGLPALAGLLAVGIFADGTAGAGYNGVGIEEYLGAAGQGVTGLLAASGLAADWPGQLLAQAAGVAVIFLLSFLVVSLLALPAALVIRAWGGRGVAAADEGGEAGEEVAVSGA
ncbi:MAG: hypothetical protein K1X65_11130 [Caldilineales bacterium]|nr:hypothetical protein [Caldilineales bacterium]MCW5859975.1 hypothetical protein [Caldilineales bacterium]